MTFSEMPFQMFCSVWHQRCFEGNESNFFLCFISRAHVSEAVGFAAECGFLLVVFGRLDDLNSSAVCFLLLITSDCTLLSCNFRFLVLGNIGILRLTGAGTPLICRHLSHSNPNCWGRLNLQTLCLKW